MEKFAGIYLCRDILIITGLFHIIGNEKNDIIQYIDGLVLDCSNSIVNSLELLQSFTKPSICRALLTMYSACVIETWKDECPNSCQLTMTN